MMTKLEQEIYNLIKKKGRIRCKDISRITGRHYSGTQVCLRWLHRKGYVVKERKGISVYYSVKGLKA